MMDRRSDTTTLSPTPFSPFSPAHSTHSFASGSDAGTSDEPADLGEFTSVFRALNELHLGSAPTVAHRIAASRTDSQNQALGTPSSSLLVSPSDDDERDLIDFNDYVDEGDSVWNNNEVSEYLGFGDALEEFSRAGPSSYPQRRRSHSLSAHRELYPTHSEDLLASDSEDVEVNISVSPARSYSRSQSPPGNPVIPTRMPATSILDNLDSINQPSLGLLDEALGFLQAEREKFAAQREAGIRIPVSAISASNSTYSYGMSSSLPLSRSLSQKDVDSTFQSQASTSESRSSAWRHVIEPRRKRRRKRGGKNGGASANGNGTGVNSVVMSASGSGQEVDGEAETNGSLAPTSDALDAGSSSGPEAEFSYARGGKSMPATPPRASRRAGKGTKGKQPALAVSIPNTAQGHKLSHSRSTPSLRPGPVNFMSAPAVQTASGASVVASTDPRVLRLRALATKLRMFFIDDAEALSAVLKGPGLSQARKVNGDADDDGDLLIDPRGRPPEEDDPIVHVFIDHSNILIGFLNYIRRFPSRRHLTSTSSPGGSQSRGHASWHMSHAALALILERGRSVSRRVLVTSSPLYQPMESAERLGYEVRVYARVPDTGDGADRLAKAERLGGGRFGRINGDLGVEGRRARRRAQAPMMTHARKISTGESADSDPGSANAPKDAKEKGHSRASSLNAIQAQAGVNGVASRGLAVSTAAGTSPQRIRYREQGVDELLQLKLLQAVSSVDTPHPPPKSTIVLATGDGNVGQFNEEGFRGCVRTALKRGWRVELYAWENGMSRSWLSEFGSGMSSSPEDGGGPYGDRFKIIGLERFAQDLLELPS
ncbi:hypothetical protein SCHPADRAFT_996026 [Schizopora paradoxa]|uniref:NYN domain-containing protein n=1 Tax=Schizopora paradoxa TaxID=27342 RepID=A0A0H2RUA8_9AGAM|nr:hypothetical protein SCHPADRAFT_996026 [Schizopora paradoxa]